MSLQEVPKSPEATEELKSEARALDREVRALSLPRMREAVRCHDHHSGTLSRKIRTLADVSRRPVSSVEQVTDEELLQQLKHPEGAIRLSALEAAIPRIGSFSEGAPELLVAIADLIAHDPELGIRKRAIAEMGQAVSSEVIDLLGGRAAVVGSMLQVLSEKGDGMSLRLPVLEALGRLGFDEPTPELIEIGLQDPSAGIRASAVNSLSMIYWRSSPAQGDSRFHAWIRNRKMVVAAMETMLQGERSLEVQQALINGFALVGDADGFQPLLKALDREKHVPSMKEAIVTALCSLSVLNRSAFYEDPTVVQTLNGMLLDKSLSADVRGAIVEVFRLNSLGQSSPELLSGLSDGDEGIVKKTLETLSAMQDRSINAELRALYERTSSSALKFRTAALLVKKGDDSLLEDLAATTKARALAPDEVRLLADALRGTNNRRATSLLFELHEQLGDKPQEFRFEVESALAELSWRDAPFRELLAKRFGLTGLRKSIWENYGVVIREGTRKLSEQRLNQLNALLGVFTDDELSSLKLISTDLPRNFGWVASAETQAKGMYLGTSEGRSPESFAEVFFHELAHLSFAASPISEQMRFEKLYLKACEEGYKNSGEIEEVVKSFPSEYGRTNLDEFQAELQMNYRLDSAKMIREALLSNSPARREQVIAVARLFQEHDSEGRASTMLFQVQPDGTILRRRVPVGEDGLPVLPR